MTGSWRIDVIVRRDNSTHSPECSPNLVILLFGVSEHQVFSCLLEYEFVVSALSKLESKPWVLRMYFSDCSQWSWLGGIRGGSFLWWHFPDRQLSYFLLMNWKALFSTIAIFVDTIPKSCAVSCDDTSGTRGQTEFVANTAVTSSSFECLRVKASAIETLIQPVNLL